MAKEVIKIMVSSAVYGYESEIQQICSIINSYKSNKYRYKVLNSHIGSIPSIPGLSPMDSCLRAVDDCDYFFGIILPRYGSGITHKEFNRAVKLDKPRGYLSHYTVVIAKYLLAQYMYLDIKTKKKNPNFIFKKTPIFEDTKIIDMYNEAIGDGKPIDKRLWAQEFGHKSGDALIFVEALFGDIDRFKKDLDKIKQ
ncbi:MAG: hypothetical protein CSB01_01465 [Bacteroidia bacterium]|nr:MAG: hypothetical protein CSB01_01465 [Bacteroidia bacterium]